jgi:glucose/arabinose dehydrogenase
VSSAGAATLPSGFRDTVAIGGLDVPTAFRFTDDGAVFVAEKTGKIFRFDSLADTEPSFFADLRTDVYDSYDRGLLGLAVDPQFPTRPYVYALYSYDHELGSSEPAPRWGVPGEDGDGGCPEPPGANTDGCVISGRLVRLTAEGDHAAEEGGGGVAQHVLVEDWCQQFSSHSIGALEFGPEGALIASGGDGAAFTDADYGQFGWPDKNPCGDPPGEVGDELTPPTAIGGALRSQNTENLNGSVIRIDPDTGEGWPANPMHASLDPNQRRILAYGFRNPFRFTIQPETDDVYVANVGWYSYEELDRFSLSTGSAYNSGWPCLEGPDRVYSYEILGLDACEAIYDEPAPPPFFLYAHHAAVAPEDPCPFEPGAAISGLEFYEGGSYPPEYDGALFFADSVRGCIYSMQADHDGEPDPFTTTPFLIDGGLYPGMDIQIGPGGDLFYATLFDDDEYGPGAIHRISYDADAPQAGLEAGKEWGAVPLEVEFDAGASTDPQSDSLEYEWDLDGDGVFDAATPDSTESETYEDPENVIAQVRVVDPGEHSSVAQVTVYPGDSPPAPEIEEPLESLEWGVGQSVSFSGLATDFEGGVPENRLYWTSRLYHCPGGPGSCHGHPLEVFPATGSGAVIAPDHDLPSHIELRLTATDARGLSATTKVDVYPTPVTLHLASDPPGVTLSAREDAASAPFDFEAIEDAQVTLSAPPTAELDGTVYTWSGWSDGGARIHSVTADEAATYTAFYEAPEPAPEEPPTGPPAPAPPAGGGEPIADAPPPAAKLALKLRRRPAKATRSGVARFVFAAGEPGVRFRCKLDKGRFKPCRSPVVYRKLRPGKHVFRVVVIGGGKVRAKRVFRWTVRPIVHRRSGAHRASRTP